MGDRLTEQLGCDFKWQICSCRFRRLGADVLHFVRCYQRNEWEHNWVIDNNNRRGIRRIVVFGRCNEAYHERGIGWYSYWFDHRRG